MRERKAANAVFGQLKYEIPNSASPRSCLKRCAKNVADYLSKQHLKRLITLVKIGITDTTFYSSFNPTFCVASYLTASRCL